MKKYKKSTKNQHYRDIPTFRPNSIPWFALFFITIFVLCWLASQDTRSGTLLTSTYEMEEKGPWNRNWIKLINFRLYQQSTCSTTTTFRFPFSPWWIIWPPRRTRPLNWTLQNINKYVYPFRFPSFLYKKIVRKGSVSIFFYKRSNLPALSPGPWSSDYLCDGRGRWTRSSCESDHSSCRTSQQENCMSVQTRRGCSLAYLCDWKELQRHHHAEEHESQLELGRQRMAPPFSLMA